MTTKTHFINTHLLKQLTKEQLIDLIEVTNNELRNKIIGENVKVDEPVCEPVEDLATRRKRAIEFAKESLEKLKTKKYFGEYYKIGSGHCCDAKFHVNKNKRTVTVLLKGQITGKLYSKGIAKCDPSDVFNVHIGKSIALYRALNIKVPELLLTAEHDGNTEQGDIVEFEGKKYEICDEKQGKFGFAHINSMVGTKGKIIDDSKE